MELGKEFGKNGERPAEIRGVKRSWEKEFGKKEKPAERRGVTRRWEEKY